MKKKLQITLFYHPDDDLVGRVSRAAERAGVMTSYGGKRPNMTEWVRRLVMAALEESEREAAE